MMHVLIPSKQESAIRWYTQENEKDFKHLMFADATRQSSVYLAAKEENPNAPLPMGELIKCVGVVHLLSEDVSARYQEFKENRLVHVYRVLSEQERQREQMGGRCDDKLLANVSRLSSKEARDRALKIAYLSVGSNRRRRASC